jgi:hypothetical protein
MVVLRWSRKKFDGRQNNKINYYTNRNPLRKPGSQIKKLPLLSRSSHQSFWYRSRGEDVDYLEILNGEPLTNKLCLCSQGIDTSWNRVPGGKVNWRP